MIKIQQLNEHLLYTHMVTEPFAIALRRRVARNHPLYRLMYTHLQHIIAVDSYARGVMISPGGTIDRVMSTGTNNHVKNYILQIRGTYFLRRKIDFLRQLL